MASTLPPPSSQDRMVFIPPTKRTRTASGKGSSFTPTRNGPTRSVYGDQILNVQGRGPGSSSEHLETDALGSLERLQGLPGTMGTLRSIRSNGSVPTLERVRREESNHSIGSHSQTSSGQVSERSTDIDLVREAVHQKRSLRTRKASESRLSRGNSRSASANTSTDELDRISVVTTEERLRSIQSAASEERLQRVLPAIQARPLPDLPEKEVVQPLPKLQMRINANDEAIEILGPDHVRDECIGGPGVSMTLREGVLESTDEKSFLVKNPTGFLTVTGTIKRGKNKGEVFDVQLKMNRDRLAKIEKEIQERESQCCCGLTRGLHVLLASILLVPFLWLFCTLYAFYMGTLTWYNVFIYYNEQRTCCHTVFVSPVVLLVYPLWILPSTIALGLYGGLRQVSWSGANWRKELGDPEKGFYGWICNKLSLPDCSPYQVVILTAGGPEDPGTLTSVI